MYYNMKKHATQHSKASKVSLLQFCPILRPVTNLNLTENTFKNIESDTCHNEEVPIFICMKTHPLSFVLLVFRKHSS